MEREGKKIWVVVRMRNAFIVPESDQKNTLRRRHAMLSPVASHMVAGLAQRESKILKGAMGALVDGKGAWRLYAVHERHLGRPQAQDELVKA